MLWRDFGTSPLFLGHRRPQDFEAAKEGRIFPLCARSPRVSAAFRLLYHDVRLDSSVLDAATVRRVISRDCKLEPASVRKLDDVLHQPLAVGLRSDDYRSSVVLKRSDDDF